MSEPDLPETESTNRFERWKLPLLVGGFCLFALAVLVRIAISYFQSGQSDIEFEEIATSASAIRTEIKVDAAGAVERPGVYTLNLDSRVQDLLLVAGGLSEKADRAWVAKHINLAAKLVDGSKVYVPLAGEVATGFQTVSAVQGANISSNSIININTASEAELDTLPGVGEVTVGKIIAGRPFQKTQELLDKKIVNKNTWEKIKDKVSVY